MKKVILSIVALATCGSMMAGVTPHFGLELGYDHGWAHVRTPDGGYSYYFDEAQMDGFHFGGNVQLDFLDGQHKPGLVIGLNYQFLTKNMLSKQEREQVNEWKSELEDKGATNVTASDYSFMHTIQIPIRFQYTYQFNNDLRFFVNSGPQVRLHLAFSDDVKVTGKIDGKKNGFCLSQDYVSGKGTMTTWVNGNKNSETETLENRDRLDCFDMSWGFGIGFGWKALSLNLNYDLGMINLFNRDLNGWRYNSDALAVTIGYRIK